MISMALDKLADTCKQLGIKVEPGKLELVGGKTEAILALQHGKHTLIAMARSPITAVLAYVIQLEDADVEVLAKQSPQLIGRLAAVLKREMLEGRSGYAFVPHPVHVAAPFGQIRIEQQIIVGEGALEKQRLLDGMQELVVCAIRCIEVLGHAFSAIHESLPAHPEYTFV